MEDIQIKKQNQQLFLAVLRGEYNAVKKLLEDGIKPVFRDREGKTALILAIQYNQIDTVNLLINNGSDMNYSDKDGWTPLHFSVDTGNVEMTNLLLSKSADPNYRTISGKNSPLHIAASKGFTNLIIELLSVNAKINIKNRTRHTPLHAAVNEIQINAAKTLLNSGANPNTKDKYGKAPLTLAIEKNNVELVSILLSSDSFDVDDFMKTNPFILHDTIISEQRDIANVLVTFVPNLNLENDERNSSLILASIKGYNEIVESLIKNGCDINSVDKQDWTSLHHAAYHGHLEIAKILLSANLGSFINTAKSVLHLAVLGGHINMIEYLVSSGFSIEFKNEHDQTALQLAVEESQIECAIKLLELGSDPNVENKYGEKLILSAIRQRKIDFIAALLAPGKKISADNLLKKAIDTKQEEIVKMLLENGGYLNLNTDDGFGVMKSALLNNFHPDIFNLLLKYGCKVNAQDSKGQSLLQFVVSHNREDILMKLIESQVDINSRSFEGYTAMHFAAALGLTNMIDILASAGADINAVKTNTRMTPIVAAVCTKNINSVKKLIELGCDPNTVDENGISLLDMAISQGMKEIEQVLLIAGANPYVQTVSDDQAIVLRLIVRNGALIESEDDLNRNISKKGDFQWTALHHAVSHGMFDLCVRFLNAGADPNWTTVSGESTLHIAVANERVNLIELLIHYGANIYLKSAGGNTPLEWGVLWNRPMSIDKMLEFHAQRENDTMENICNREKLLYLAIRNNKMESFHYLLSKGANPNIHNNEGLPLLCSMILLENIPFIDILLSLPNIDIEIKESPKNETPLLIATRLGKTNIVLKLIELGANVNVYDIKGDSPLSYAVKGKNADLVNVFIEHGAQTSSQQLLLHRAVLDDQVAIVELLIDRIDIDFANEAGNTPLMIAVQKENYNIMKILLENGARINIINNVTGSTILHEAIENITDLTTFKKVFDCLINYGADMNITVPNKGTPLFRAIELEKDEIASILIKNGADLAKKYMYRERECSYFELALKNKLELTVFYLVLSGFKLPNIVIKNPWFLRHIAKLCIRSSIPKENFVKSVKSLPIPKPLQLYLVYEGPYLDSQENLECELREIIHNYLRQ